MLDFFRRILVRLSAFRNLVLTTFKQPTWHDVVADEPCFSAFCLLRPGFISAAASRYNTVPYQTALTLDAIDLRIEPGQLVGVVGPVGSSKSSLLMAVLREIAPERLAGVGTAAEARTVILGHFLKDNLCCWGVLLWARCRSEKVDRDQPCRWFGGFARMCFVLRGDLANGSLSLVGIA